jgi:hypothetical protein
LQQKLLQRCEHSIRLLLSLLSVLLALPLPLLLLQLHQEGVDMLVLELQQVLELVG